MEYQSLLDWYKKLVPTNGPPELKYKSVNMTLIVILAVKQHCLGFQKLLSFSKKLSNITSSARKPIFKILHVIDSSTFTDTLICSAIRSRVF